MLNLASLATFKYLDFLIGSLQGRIGIELPRAHILLPIGISFFSFQLISYLVDRMRDDAPIYPLRPFALFVLLFPHLIAGPIVRHNELVPQFDARPAARGLWQRIGAGLVMFTIGFAKKVLLADKLADMVDPLFARGRARSALVRRRLDGGAGLLVPAVPRFFRLHRNGDRHRAAVRPAAAGEFPPALSSRPTCATSGAAGTSRCRNFIRDYLYIPLGGSRHGAVRYVFATLVAMAIVRALARRGLDLRGLGRSGTALA